MNSSRHLGRRTFLRKGSGLAVGVFAGQGLPALAAEIKPKAPAAPAAAAKPPTPVTCAVIGVGDQGRDLLKALGALPGASVKAVCDTYGGIHKRALELAPKATASDDFRKVLADKTVQ